MAQIYYNLIKKGLKTIEEVPLRWRTEVQAMLDAEVSNEHTTEPNNG